MLNYLKHRQLSATADRLTIPTTLPAATTLQQPHLNLTYLGDYA